MEDRIVQRVVMPPRRGVTRLYCRFNRSLEREKRRPRLPGRRTLILPRGCAVWTDTWFNAFFESYWRQYTSLQDLALRLQVSGAGVLRIFRRSPEQRPSLLHEVDFSGENRELRIRIVDAPADPGGLGLLFFEIESCSPRLTMHRAAWIAENVMPRSIRLAAAYCTFNRAAQLIHNVAGLFSDADVAEILDRVIVVDQGEKKVRDHPAYDALMEAADGRLHVVEQKNYGGAGGFTRSLLEAQNAGSATHVVLMDDDAIGEPESILRAAAFLSLARSDLAVGGSMLDEFRPRELVESGSRYLPEHLRIDEPRRRCVDRPRDLTPFLQPRPGHYNGWWFLAFPLAVLDRVGLPLPLFLRGDDLEFGCRLLRNGVPTVTLPGVGVWHEPFERKGRGWHAFYELRNFLIVGALHFPIVRAATVARRFFSRLLDELLAYDYYESWLQCEAATAYLRGPEALRDPPLAVHHSLQAMQRKLGPTMQPRDDTPRAPLRQLPRIHAHVARVRRLWLVLRNLLRPSPAAEAAPWYVLRGPGEQWYDVDNADVVGVAEPHREQVVILRRSRGRFVRLLLRGLRLSLELFLFHRRAVRRWRGSAPDLMSQTFWTAYLGTVHESIPRLATLRRSVAGNDASAKRR
jgi:galactofuranosylgalactofuranosylrhamnosyl-N-acetylglucosaminyl-diphospho-decaprenol beta-1,5/1,6-galactofuranosyltransferase